MQKSPAELRSMFGKNLALLSQRYPSVSELSRRLGVNRTQFNRYLAGESFPRPDILYRICNFFDVDARILLEPLDEIDNTPPVLTSEFLNDYIGNGVTKLTAQEFPSGFYRFSRRSFIDADQFIVGLVFVFRNGPLTFVRGFEARDAVRQQGLPTIGRAREFRGFVSRHEDGIALTISRHDNQTSSFNYLSRVPSFENNYWLGYVVRTVREEVTGSRAERMVYEHLGHDLATVLPAARTTGYFSQNDLLPFHRNLLRPEDPFR